MVSVDMSASRVDKAQENRHDPGRPRARQTNRNTDTTHATNRVCCAALARAVPRWQWHGRRGRGGFITDESTARAISMGA